MPPAVTTSAHRTLRLAALIGALLATAACGAADRPPAADGVVPSGEAPVAADEGAALAEATATTVVVATTAPVTVPPEGPSATVAPAVAAELDAVATAIDQELATLDAELAELDALLTE
jgi:hypothetical protein